jgi:three-Cys-motif partner protein
MSYGNDSIGEWSKLKLQYLSAYLPCYTKVTSKAMHRFFIDGFAGKGIWIIKESKEEIKGSPLIALNTEPPFTKCFFIEKDQNRLKELTEYCANYPSNKYEIIAGDCNLEMENVLSKINMRAPTFVFLDPSAGHLSWDTIELLSEWRTELFINFPLHMDLQRNLPNDLSKLGPSNEKKLNMVFGNEKWRDIYNRKFASSGLKFSTWSLMELYISGLQELGYTFINYSDVIKNNSGQKLYYMIWAGKHPVGQRIIEHVLTRQFKEQLDLSDFL